MSSDAALAEAKEAHDALCRLVDGQELPATLRGRLAAGCFWIALDLHAAIILLIERGMIASAFVLSRPIWEALIRGLWLSECADGEALLRFKDDKDSLKPWPMIQALEQKDAFDSRVLSKVHEADKQRLNTTTHIGGPLAVRCNSGEAIENNFDPAEITECLNNANAIAGLAALGIARLSDNGEMAERLLDLSKSWSSQA